SGFHVPVIGADSARQDPATTKLTKENLKAIVGKCQSLVFENDWDRAIADLKGLGPSSKIQRMLGELYPDANAKERITILHILNKVGVEHAVAALPQFAADFAVARPNHPNDMSFAGAYVLEKFMHLAWNKLPSTKNIDQKKL